MSNAPVKYVPGFIEAIGGEYFFDRLWKELTWERRPTAPRREYWTNEYNRSYTYGRGAGERTYESHPDHEIIIAVRTLIKHQFGTHLEGCFLNGYENEKDALGWHADDDPAIDHSKPIAVVTLYDKKSAKPREIHFRDVIDPGSETTHAVFGLAQSQELEHGSLLLMNPGMQTNWQHKIPKAGFISRPRISLTFRGLFA